MIHITLCVCVCVCEGAAGMFAIDSSSGELYVSDVVDREHQSLQRSDGVVHMTVQVIIMSVQQCSAVSSLSSIKWCNVS